MKKLNLYIFILILSFPMILFFHISGAKAESRGDLQKDLVSILHLKSAGLLGSSENTSERSNKFLQNLRIPLDESLNVYFDFNSPEFQSLMSRDNSTDFRAFFGLNILFR
ncbi:MAG: hypothetical protein AB1632_11185 [Nitrospirota bacterium]